MSDKIDTMGNGEKDPSQHRNALNSDKERRVNKNLSRLKDFWRRIIFVGAVMTGPATAPLSAAHAQIGEGGARPVRTAGEVQNVHEDEMFLTPSNLNTIGESYWNDLTAEYDTDVARPIRTAAPGPDLAPIRELDLPDYQPRDSRVLETKSSHDVAVDRFAAEVPTIEGLASDINERETAQPLVTFDELQIHDAEQEAQTSTEVFTLPVVNLTENDSLLLYTLFSRLPGDAFAYPFDVVSSGDGDIIKLIDPSGVEITLADLSIGEESSLITALGFPIDAIRSAVEANPQNQQRIWFAVTKDSNGAIEASITWETLSDLQYPGFPTPFPPGTFFAYDADGQWHLFEPSPIGEYPTRIEGFIMSDELRVVLTQYEDLANVTLPPNGTRFLLEVALITLSDGTISRQVAKIYTPNSFIYVDFSNITIINTLRVSPANETLNVRSGPGTTFADVGTIRRNSTEGIATPMPMGEANRNLVTENLERILGADVLISGYRLQVDPEGFYVVVNPAGEEWVPVTFEGDQDSDPIKFVSKEFARFEPLNPGESGVNDMPDLAGPTRPVLSEAEFLRLRENLADRDAGSVISPEIRGSVPDSILVLRDGQIQEIEVNDFISRNGEILALTENGQELIYRDGIEEDNPWYTLHAQSNNLVRIRVLGSADLSSILRLRDLSTWMRTHSDGTEVGNSDPMAAVHSPNTAIQLGFHDSSESAAQQNVAIDQLVQIYGIEELGLALHPVYETYPQTGAEILEASIVFLAAQSSHLDYQEVRARLANPTSDNAMNIAIPGSEQRWNPAMGLEIIISRSFTHATKERMVNTHRLTANPEPELSVDASGRLTIVIFSSNLAPANINSELEQAFSGIGAANGLVDRRNDPANSSVREVVSIIYPPINSTDLTQRGWPLDTMWNPAPTDITTEMDPLQLSTLFYLAQP